MGLIEAYVPCFTTNFELPPALLRGGDGGGLVLTHGSSKAWIPMGARPSYAGKFSRGW